MKTIRKATNIFFTIGILLAGWGHLLWIFNRHSEKAGIYALVALVPGWSLIIMGWTGFVAGKISTHLKRMQN